MWALIIDDNQLYVERLREYLKKGPFNPVNRGLGGINYSTDSAYAVAEKIAQATSDTPGLLIFINIDLKLRNGRRQDQTGVDVLKYFRLIESSYPSQSVGEVINRARDAHCLMYSLRTREELLKQRPENVILMSEGTTFIRLPSDFVGLDLKKSSEQKAELNSLGPYFRIDLTLPDDRHDWANWWGIRQLYEVHKLVENRPTLRYPPKVQEELQSLRSKQAIYLYGSNDREIKAAYDNLSDRILELRTLLGESPPKILYIDDRWEDGWGTILTKMIYRNAPAKAKQKDPGTASLPYTDFFLGNDAVFRVLTSFGIDGMVQEPVTTRLSAVQKGIKEAVKFDPDLILLDLRLFNEPGIQREVKTLSGAKVLKWLREQFQSIPVIMTTASNKVWSLEKLLQLGADAFWVKEGLDERRSADETVRNYWRVLDLIAKTTDEKYEFLNKFDRERLKLFRGRRQLWWQEYVWNEEKAPKDVTRGRRTKVESILKDTVLMLRSYLQQYELGYGYESQVEERNWAAAILRHAANVIEEVHGIDPAFPYLGRSGPRNGTRLSSGAAIGGYERLDRKKGTKVFETERGDWFGYELYAFRNKASHYVGAQSMSWGILKNFLASLLCYLTYGPQASFSREGITKTKFRGHYGEASARLAKLRTSSPDYESLFNKLVG